MTNKIDELLSKAKGNIDIFSNREEVKASIDWTKQKSIAAGEKAKKFSKTELGKQMLIPAVLGALIAIPIPIVGPIIGALAGGWWGYYNYMSKRRVVDIDGASATSSETTTSSAPSDLPSELAQLDLLKRSGALSDDEFKIAKQSILKKYK